MSVSSLEVNAILIKTFLNLISVLNITDFMFLHDV